MICRQCFNFIDEDDEAEVIEESFYLHVECEYDYFRDLENEGRYKLFTVEEGIMAVCEDFMDWWLCQHDAFSYLRASEIEMLDKMYRAE